ncbi:MAG: tetratricopeptide repeat protein, partial [Ktedonobacteraceae bacterium]|nr:tetratricopeptide repeat protein [Ktedonobacteraceae bacterium]
YPQAEALYQRALAIREQQLEPTHPHTAFTLHDLANMYRDQGKYQQAESLYQRAQVIYEQHLGPEHPRTSKIRHDRGHLEGSEKPGKIS